MFRFRTELIFKTFIQAAALAFIAVVLALAFNNFRAQGLPLTTDWSPEARLKTAAGDSLILSAEQAWEFHLTREALFVDARSPQLYAEGHIAGALNVPWQDVDRYLDSFFKKVTDPKAIVIAYCDGESCSLSEDLALELRDMGYSNVKVILNGMTVWKTRGYPIETGAYREP
jgi:rhodanese-related sulfurtransferase